ncbi:MAG: phosphoglycerate dehydrogenase [Cyanobium sp. PLM2.Bin73]|nr:MAG: phosphoglycerate dehydrogenase [Cyanobium sp. PLM2.Bin73]
MLGMLEAFVEPARALGLELVPAAVTQTLSEAELIDLLPQFEGWIIGDDPATQQVFEAGQRGCLKAAVKWGIGVDNVDFKACEALGIPITNTPGMFGGEVADVAVGYVIALARHTVEIDRSVRSGGWPKPRGLSLAGHTVAVVGYGDIGRNTARRLLAADMQVIAYDPYVEEASLEQGVSLEAWPGRLTEADFVVVNCALTPSSHHLLNAAAFAAMKPGVRVVNVGRGPVIDEQALIGALASGQVHSAALDVFEQEPLPAESPLRNHPSCIFGSHNASNTMDGVERTSHKAIQLLAGFLQELQP